ncbi:hypothetical protein Dip510_001447 [Elusimicrobium posterum]|uniref:hypothetical protein n=1 Tax=Elusimicrobium posterum TaxID=3116653 RepID=UPI003C73F031
MNKTTEYFKSQAKNLFRDYKTKFFNQKEDIYDYKPRFFDINQIVLDFDIDEEGKFTLMNAQHIIAVMAGFHKWTDLIKASDVELELAKLLFDNQDKIGIDEWEMYISRLGYDNKTFFQPEEQIEIFKTVFANEDGHSSMTGDYRINVKRKATPQKHPEANISEKELYVELKGKAKQAAIDKQRKAGLGFAPDTKIECLHCGEKFLFQEAKVSKLKSKHKHNPLEYIVCKNFPKCDGDLIDFMPVKSDT